MSTKLKTFIDMNRQQLDAFAPSAQLWQKIDAGMQQPAFIKSKISWLRYFAYGASAIVAVVGLRMLLTSDTAVPATPSQASVTVNNVQPETNAAVATDTTKNNTAVVPATPTAPAPQQLANEIPVEPTTNPTAPEPAAPPVAYAAPQAPQEPVMQTAATSNFPKIKSKNTQLKVDTSFAGISHLEVTVACCNITVKPSGTPILNVKAMISTQERGIVIGEKDYQVTYERKDSTLKIRIENKAKKSIVIAGASITNASIDITIPENIALLINDTYGDVAMSNIKTRTFDLFSSSGDVQLENTVGDLRLSSHYGDISLKNVKGNIQVMAGSGDLSIEQLEGNSTIEATYGTLSMKKINGTATINASSGDVKITEMAGNLTVISQYGNIHLENYKGTPSLEAVSGDIIGKNVEIKDGMTTKSTYGSIRMKLANNFDDLSFDLSTHYGTISIPGMKTDDSEGKIVTSKGKILIKGYSSSGDQNYQ